MKKDFNAEITLLKHYGPHIHKTGSAHLATKQVPAQEALAAEAEEDEDEEGVITLDLTGVSEEKAEALVMAARTSGLRVRPPFCPAGRKPFPKARAKPRPTTPPQARDPKCANCGGEHTMRYCKKPMLPEEKQTCFKCGKEDHRVTDCNLPTSADRATTAGLRPWEMARRTSSWAWLCRTC